MSFKKLFIAAMLITSTAIAVEGGFYIKPMFSRHQSDKIIGMKAKPVISPGFAIGYDFKDNLRMDLSIEHYSNIKHTKLLKNECAEQDENSLIPSNLVCTHTKITTAKLNIYVDILEVKEGFVYVGLGLGTSRAGGAVTFGENEAKLKTTYDMAYAAHAGISQKLYDNVHIEFGYSFKHLTENIYNYKGHSILSAIRVYL